MTLLLTIWLWTAPACGEPVFTFRVESVHRYVVAFRDGRDDNGSLISEPIYNVWEPTFISEGPEMQAEDGCEPGAGECCVMIVTSVDAAGNVDLGEECP